MNNRVSVFLVVLECKLGKLVTYAILSSTYSTVLVCFYVGSIKKQCLPLSVLWDLVVIPTCWIQLCVLVTLFWHESSVLVISPGTLGKESKRNPFSACTMEQPCDDCEAFGPKINKINHFWSLPSYLSSFCQDINWPFQK